MWPLGNNRWAYKLYGPLNILGSFSYRYCRNGQCGSADDGDTVGASPNGRQASTSILSQDIQDTVNTWKWFENPEPVTLVGSNITARANGFNAGIEFQSTYRPNWSYYAPQAFANVQALGSNLAILTPSWTSNAISRRCNFHHRPGRTRCGSIRPSWSHRPALWDLNAALFPTPLFPVPSNSLLSPSDDFWLSAPRDAQWWQSWFTRYRAFAVNYADLASQTGAQTLILGGDWVAPALPNGKLSNGTLPTLPPMLKRNGNPSLRMCAPTSKGRFSGQCLTPNPVSKRR